MPHLLSPPLSALPARVHGLLLLGAMAGALLAPVRLVAAVAPPPQAPAGLTDQTERTHQQVRTVAEIAEACLAARRSGDLASLPAAQVRLRSLLPLRPSLEGAEVFAEAMLACGAPEGALAALARVSPSPGPERRRWLELQWRAAHAGLHHRLAAQALRLLAEGELARLETLMLPVAWPQEGRDPPRRAALDLLAEHLESLQEDRLAAEVLLAGRSTGALQAARLGRAAALARHLPAGERQALSERALEQAAAAQAWGLVAELLDRQLAADGGDGAWRRALERRLRLGARTDDAYGEWVQRRRQPDAAVDPRLPELEAQLRSPRGDGGHASPDGAADPPSSPLP